MNNLVTRTITGIVFAILVIGAIIWNPFILALLMAIFTFIGSKEYVMLLKNKQIYHKLTPFICSSLIIYIISAFVGLNLLSSSYLFIIPIIAFLYVLISLFNPHARPFEEIGSAIFGFLYVPIPFSMMIWAIDFHPSSGSMNFYTLLGFFIILWMNDTFAYLTGSLIGKHKLFPRISPKKTWEGSIGGAVFGLLFAVGIYFTTNTLTIQSWLIIGLLTVILGSLGDLVESMLKRNANVKDSGAILPGHGGVLDRFDAALFSIPFITAYLYMFIY
ncbi:MAG: phosphatidate cytidylyltransferase [Hyphomicrobiales bacterium]